MIALLFRRRSSGVSVVRYGVGLCLLAALAAGSVRAQGFDVYEQSACAMGRAETGVAAPCGDGSTILYNPAGLVGQPGWSASAGVTLIRPVGGFTDDATGQTFDGDDAALPAPHAYLRYGAGRWAAGLGVLSLYGLRTRWENPDTFIGRFLSYDSALESIYFQPTLAYRVSDRLALGAGFDVVVSTVELNQRLDLGPVPALAPGVPPGTTFEQLGIPQGTDFADAHLEGDPATGFGAHVGALLRLTDRIRLGARYLSPVTIEYEGDAVFEPVETGIVLPEGNPLGLPAGTSLDAVVAGIGFFESFLAPQGVTTEVTLPAQFVVGLSLAPAPPLLLLFDYQWTGWSTFDVVVLDFETAPDDVSPQNYRDTSTLRVGAEYALSSGLRVRAGYAFSEAATPDETVTPLLPEADRNHFTVGLGWDLAPGFALHASYRYLDQQDRRGRIRDPLPGAEPTVALNSGVYRFNGHLLATTLTARF